MLKDVRSRVEGYVETMIIVGKSQPSGMVDLPIMISCGRR